MVPGSRSFLCFHRPLAEPQLQSVKTIPLPLGTSRPPAVHIATAEFTMLVNGPSLDGIDLLKSGHLVQARTTRSLPWDFGVGAQKEESLCTWLEPYATVAMFCHMARAAERPVGSERRVDIVAGREVEARDREKALPGLPTTMLSLNQLVHGTYPALSGQACPQCPSPYGSSQPRGSKYKLLNKHLLSE